MLSRIEYGLGYLITYIIAHIITWSSGCFSRCYCVLYISTFQPWHLGGGGEGGGHDCVLYIFKLSTLFLDFVDVKHQGIFVYYISPHSLGE